MEIDFAPSHNPTLFGSLSVSPSTSVFDSFSPLIHFNDDFLNVFDPLNSDDDVEDWIKPLLFDQLLEHDLQQNLNLNDIDIKEEEKRNENKNEKLINVSSIIEDNSDSNENSESNSIVRESQSINYFSQQPSEQRMPSTTTATVRLIQQPKIEPKEIPTTLYLNGNELQYHPVISRNTTTHGTIIGHTYTTTSSPISTTSIQTSLPIVSTRIPKGKKFKRGGRVTSRATSRSTAAAKRRLNATGAEPKASVVIIAEDATRIDSKTTTLGLSSTNNNDTDLIKATSTNSTRSSNRRRIKTTPREVILFRNGTFISKEPLTKQQSTAGNNNCSPSSPPFQQQQITANGLQAAAQIVACNVLRQATLNDALIEQLIKGESPNTDDNSPINCYSTPSLSSPSRMMTTAMDEYENSCSTSLKILGCNTTTPLPSINTTTTIELLTFAALQQRQQQQQQQQKFCYIKQEPISTTTTFLLPRLLPQ